MSVEFKHRPQAAKRKGKSLQNWMLDGNRLVGTPCPSNLWLPGFLSSPIGSTSGRASASGIGVGSRAQGDPTNGLSRDLQTLGTRGLGMADWLPALGLLSHSVRRNEARPLAGFEQNKTAWSCLSTSFFHFLFSGKTRYFQLFVSLPPYLLYHMGWCSLGQGTEPASKGMEPVSPFPSTPCFLGTLVSF